MCCFVKPWKEQASRVSFSGQFSHLSPKWHKKLGQKNKRSLHLFIAKIMGNKSNVDRFFLLCSARPLSLLDIIAIGSSFLCSTIFDTRLSSLGYCGIRHQCNIDHKLASLFIIFCCLLQRSATKQPPDSREGPKHPFEMGYNLVNFCHLFHICPVNGKPCKNMQENI